MDKKKVEELIEQIDFIAHDFIDGDKQDELQNLVSEVQEELNKSDWVSVENGLPEYGKNVLAISKDGYMNVSYRRKIPRDKISPEVMDDNGFILNFNLCCSTITHWCKIEKLEE